MNDFPFNNVHCKGDEIAKPTIQIAVHVFILCCVPNLIEIGKIMPFNYIVEPKAGGIKMQDFKITRK